jgi:hypothetical protein
MIVALALGQHDAIWRLLAQRYRVVDEQVVMDGNGNAWMVQALKLPGSRLGC